MEDDDAIMRQHLIQVNAHLMATTATRLGDDTLQMRTPRQGLTVISIK